MRHLEVQQLWFQHQVASGCVSVSKVGTDTNLADVLTKGVTSSRMQWAIQEMGLHFAEGRHPLAPKADAGVLSLCREASAKEGC